MDKQNNVLTEKPAAIYVGVSVQTFRNWRHLRKGPKYLKIGRSVRYQRCDLDAFLDQCRIDPEN